MSASFQRCEESLGPILEDEEVAYGLYSPEVFDPDAGTLTPEAIKIDDLRGPRGIHVDLCGHSTGVSVCRLASQNSLDELWLILEEIASRRTTRQIEGYAIAAVQEIRNIDGAGHIRPLDILDDGRSDYPSHAVIRGAPSLGRGALRGPKNDLIALFNRRLVRDSE